MTSQQDIPLYEEVVNGFDRLTDKVSSNESSGLRKARRQAFERFRESGFPTIKSEDWKYTNVNRFLREEYALGVAAAPASTELVATAVIPELDCYTIVLVNGVWDKRLGDPVKSAGDLSVSAGDLSMSAGDLSMSAGDLSMSAGDLSMSAGEMSLPLGLELLPVAEARQNVNLSGLFERSEAGRDRYFAALNTALFSDGLFIRLKPGTLIEKPLHIIHAFTAGHNLMVQPRHFWLVGERGELNIIESVVSAVTDASIWINSLTEVHLHGDAKLNHTLIQTAAAGARIVNHTTVRQKKQSLYNNYTFTLPGADLVRNDLQAKLEEDHTETHLYGLYLAAGQQLIDNHTLVDHQQPSCFSNELYKGVLLEQSTGVFNGKVFVHQDAQKTNAFQQNNNLVIGKKATIDSKPELEIYADDVKCSHGTTVGQFSEDALFYLRARGIGEAAARALLIAAFAFDVTEKIKWNAVETHINRLISHHIPVTA